jgi:hypothetical protein
MCSGSGLRRSYSSAACQPGSDAAAAAADVADVADAAAVGAAADAVADAVADAGSQEAPDAPLTDRLVAAANGPSSSDRGRTGREPDDAPNEVDDEPDEPDDDEPDEVDEPLDVELEWRSWMSWTHRRAHSFFGFGPLDTPGTACA